MLQGMEGKVAVVTGAGRGLGRAEAIELARQGVRVVVNDFAPPGADNPADAVVAEITAAGGEAVGSAGDVADWDYAAALVDTAIDRWGSLDILVNNAGFLRDRVLANMSEDEWDSVVRVHMKGHFCTMHHAAVHWRNTSKEIDGPVYGRIVNTTSEAGMLGSLGQINYAAAKAGIIAMTISAAQQLVRYGVTVNAIAPRARTAMTEDLGWADAMEGDFPVFAPENVSPLVAYLASPAAAKVSGQVLIVWGRLISVVSGPSVERQLDVADRWTPDAVADALTPVYDARTPIKDGYIIRYK
jgi:NAD(P)-dependent dehydrogenase (short-subunit alcohol dehydrogenase family)